MRWCVVQLILASWKILEDVLYRWGRITVASSTILELCSIKGGITSKFLNVYDFGMKMYTSKTIIALMVRKDELSLAEKFIFSGQIHTHSETLTVHLESQRALNLFYAELKT